MAVRTNVYVALFLGGCGAASPTAPHAAEPPAPLPTEQPMRATASESPAQAGSNQAPIEMTEAERAQLVQLGASVYEHKGCNACHTTDGTQRYGATFASLWGTHVTLVDGSTRLVDEPFIRDALVNPRVVRQPGYRDVMPNFDGNITPEEIRGLALFLQSLVEK